MILDTVSCFQSFDFSGFYYLLSTAAAALPLAALASQCSCGCGHNHSGDDNGELEVLRKKIADFEKSSGGSAELASLYVNAAIIQFEFGNDLDNVIADFNKAEKILKETLARSENTEIRLALGNVYLHRAVAFNDYDEYEDALKSYDAAIETLQPLDDAGDGEAKYDIAGIKLNRGTIKHEIGKLDEAKKDLDESFIAYRAVEKISNEDTRGFMAKVSVAQGHLFRDMNEPLNTVVETYNRAMRLYVELIDDGEIDLERELANVLMDRCSAYYEEYKETEFESEEERIDKIGSVLVDVKRAVEILQRVADNGNEEAKVDLLYAVSQEGSILLDLEKYEEAKEVFNGIINDFAEFSDEFDPVLLNHFASAYESRGFCSLNLNDPKGALPDFDESIKICEKIQSPSFDLEDDERSLFLPTLATYYANRANCYAALGQIDKARDDGKRGLEIVKSLKEEIGEDADELIEIFGNLLSQW
jgi:tetratricopeptide (TPR) repeat protein